MKNAKWLFLTFSLKASHLPLLSYAVNNFLLILSVAVVERELLFLSSKKWSGDFKRLWQPWIFEILVFDSYRTQFKTLNYFVVSWVFGYFWFRYFYIDTKIVMNECTTWIYLDRIISCCSKVFLMVNSTMYIHFHTKYDCKFFLEWKNVKPKSI